ncbi:MAG: hypothetical protein MRERV_7c060 [Mycoplasmataceae bacterium RV_VA103A]|nr:MAG: hypothetical protein MRERV_7c060 [Mycoplasmataceae bacterium RV_VA103A]
MTEVRNILLIGRTGNGKSTLANTLVNKNNEFEEVFKESSGSTSETRKIQKEEFEIEINSEKIKYRVIDTIGIGDTQLTPREVLNRVSEACHEVSKGLNQIFFVIRGKFTEEELETYNLLRSVIFNEEITNFTTIVRTGFTEFEKEEVCAADRKKLDKENPKLAEFIRSCNRLIYVDNTPIPIGGRPNKITAAREDREVSRQVLLKHLVNDCGNYRPIGLDRLNDRVGSYMTEKEKLQKRLEELERIKEAEKLKTEQEKRKYEEERQRNRNKLTELESKIEQQARELLNWRCIVS